MGRFASRSVLVTGLSAILLSLPAATAAQPLSGVFWAAAAASVPPNSAQAITAASMYISAVKALSPTSGASHPIGKAWCGAIVGLDYLFRQHGGLMNGEIGEIEEFTAAVGVFGRNVCERGEDLLRGVMPRIGRGGGEAPAMHLNLSSKRNAKSSPQPPR